MTPGASKCRLPAVPRPAVEHPEPQDTYDGLPQPETPVHQAEQIKLTSNNEKELPDAFLRRCVFHFIDFPERDLTKVIKSIFPMYHLSVDGLEDAVGALIGARQAGVSGRRGSFGRVATNAQPGGLSTGDGRRPPAGSDRIVHRALCRRPFPDFCRPSTRDETIAALDAVSGVENGQSSPHPQLAINTAHTTILRTVSPARRRMSPIGSPRICELRTTRRNSTDSPEAG